MRAVPTQSLRARAKCDIAGPSVQAPRTRPPPDANAPSTERSNATPPSFQGSNDHEELNHVANCSMPPTADASSLAFDDGSHLPAASRRGAWRLISDGFARDGDAIKVGVAVSGDGYNGGGAFTFALAARIARMAITGGVVDENTHAALALRRRRLCARTGTAPPPARTGSTSPS